MGIGYMRREIQHHCEKQQNCGGCELYDPFDYCNVYWAWKTMSDEKVVTLYKRLCAATRDQEAKADAGKLPLTAVPTAAIKAIAEIRRYGIEKYGDPDNYKRVEVQRYRDAAYRHWIAYLDDPHGKDEESGLPHLWHCICNLAFLVELDVPGDSDV